MTMIMPMPMLKPPRQTSQHHGHRYQHHNDNILVSLYQNPRNIKAEIWQNSLQQRSLCSSLRQFKTTHTTCQKGSDCASEFCLYHILTTAHILHLATSMTETWLSSVMIQVM
jgi:hypothetical protein